MVNFNLIRADKGLQSKAGNRRIGGPWFHQAENRAVVTTTD